MSIKTGLFVGIMASVVVICGAYSDTPTDKKTVTSKYYVDTQVATKQDKIPGKVSGSSYVMTHPTTTGGTPGSKQVVASLGTSTTASTLVTTGAINTGLNLKQEKIAAGNTGDVVTYTGTAGTVSSRGTYSSGAAYSDQTDALVSAGHLNTAISNGFNAHLTCDSWEDGYDANTPNAEDHCLTYRVNELSGIYVPQTVSNP